ncbi:hypothetical protein ES703_48917 [subsurface metagenome]
MSGVRLPAGESPMTRCKRVESVLEQLTAGQQPANKLVIKCLSEYKDLLSRLWWWQISRHK